MTLLSASEFDECNIKNRRPTRLSLEMLLRAKKKETDAVEAAAREAADATRLPVLNPAWGV